MNAVADSFPSGRGAIGAASLVLALLIPGSIAPGAAELALAPPSVSRLADPDPAVRERTMTRIATALAETPDSGTLRQDLVTAAESDDVELRRRAQVLLLQEALYLPPDLNEAVVRDAWEARWGDSPSARAQARQSLASAVPFSVPVIAGLLIDLLDAADPSEPALVEPLPAELDQALQELWPDPRYAVPLIVSALRSHGRDDVASEWISNILATTGDPVAAHHLAELAAGRGELDELIAEWRHRVARRPTAQAIRGLVTLLQHTDQPVPPDGLLDDAADRYAHAIRRGIRALIHPGQATEPLQAADEQQPAGRDEDLILRLLANAAFESSAPLADELDALLTRHQSLTDRDRSAAPSASELTLARRLAIASLTLGRVDEALEVTEPVSPLAALTVRHRRMEFDEANRLAESAPEWPEDVARQLRVTSNALRQELGRQSVRVATPPELTQWSGRLVRAVTAYRSGPGEDALEQMRALAEADPTQPGFAYAAAVAAGETGEDPATVTSAKQAALSVPLADAWMRRELAELLWMIGEEDEALAQYRRAAELGLTENLAAPLLTIYAGRLADAEQWAQAIDAFEAAMLMLASDPPPPALEDSWLYYALFSQAQIEHARMRLALDSDDLEAARAHRAAALTLLPTFSDPTIDLVAWHDARGETSQAMAVFNSGFEPIMKAAADWPQSPVLANQAAWVAARCGRRLDTALKLARTAVAGDPRSAASLDTLAEIHLLRGESERAVTEMKQVLALAEDESRFADYVLRYESIRRRAAGERDEN